MLAPPIRHKRPRSPSPPTSPNGVASPLDILLKRRRRDELIETYGWEEHAGYHLDENVEYGLSGPSRHGQMMTNGTNGGYIHGEGNSREMNGHIDGQEVGVERRRRRQWEKAQAPNQHSNLPNTSQPSFGAQHAYHQPTSSDINHVGDHAYSSYQSPIPQTSYSQPNLTSHLQPYPHLASTHQMSSSPIRHQPPSSSPFRAPPKNDGHDWEDEMTLEEMRREWGEYSSQNSLLHALHLAKSGGLPPPELQISPPFYSPTSPPHHTNQQTPSTHLETPRTYSGESYETPSHPDPYLNPQPPNSRHPIPVYHRTPQTDLTPYRHLNTYFPSSSPSFNSATTMGNGRSIASFSSTSETLYGTEHDEVDEVMDMEDEEVGEEGKVVEEEVRRRYEETNRLLGELEVARRRRWGDSG